MGRSPSCNGNNTTLKKGPWTPEEDHKLIQYVHLHGPGNWRNLPKNAGLQRCGKSCRLRWTNYLRPDIKRGRFSFEEEEAIIQLHSALGNKWSAIASRLPGRTDNEIKNYWNTHIRKRLLKMGIDPVTHSPRLDLVDLSNALNSAQLNYSNLLSLQSLVNPELLNLVTSLLASNQENQAFDHTLVQNMSQQPSQFQNCSTSSLPHSVHNPFLNQTQPLQGGDHHQVGDFEPNAVHLSSQTPDDLSFVNLSNNGWVESGHQMSNLSKEELVAFGYNNKNYGVDSVVSTTDVSSPTQLNSSSTFVNGSTEDERESYCSSLLKFEFPDSLDFSDFIM